MAIVKGQTYYSPTGTTVTKGGTTNQYYEIRLKYVLNSSNEVTNKHNVTTTLQLRRTSYYDFYGNLNATATLQGTSTTITNKAQWTQNTWYDMYSRTFDLTAGDDGKLTTNLTGSFNVNSYAWNAAATALKSANVSVSVEFPLIPRKSEVTCPSFNAGDSTNISISKKSSSFTSTITYKFGSLSGTIATKTSATVVGWTPNASDFYKQFPNSRQLSGTITCETFNGSTSIGTTTATFTCYAKEVDCKPSISISVIDVNANTKALTKNENVIVKGMSNAKITATISYKNSATSKGYTASCGDGQVSYSNPATINSVNSGEFTATVRDSRDYTNTATSSKTVNNGLLIDYVKLSITSIEIKRTESTSSTASMTIKGNYYNGNFSSNVPNTLSLQYRYREQGGSWPTSYTTLTPTLSGNTFSASKNLGNTFNPNKTYEFEFIAEDELMVFKPKETTFLFTEKPLWREGPDYVDFMCKLLNNGVDVFSSILEMLGLDKDTFSTSKTYSVGAYVVKDHILYKCIRAVTTAGAWNSSNWEKSYFFKPD